MGLGSAQVYTGRLSDALQALLGRGATTPGEYVAGLNAANVPGPNGEAWSEALLCAELARLGEGPAISRMPSEAAPVMSQPFDPAPTSVDELLEIGLNNLWYLVAPSEDVAEKPVALRRLSRNLVLWRDQAGAVQATENYCPHRGAPLSLGYIHHGHMVCAYHGLTIDGNGVILATPPTPDCPFVGEQAIRSYPVVEHAGAIWVYFGDALHGRPEPPKFPEELTSDEWTHFLFMTVVRAPWQVTIDNRVDPMHGSYLHDNSFTLAFGRKDDELKLDKIDHGFSTWRKNQQGVNIDRNWIRHHPDNSIWIRTEIPYPPSAGGGYFSINGYPMPIDRERTIVWFYRAFKATGWRRDMWRFLYKTRYEQPNFEVVEQDRIMLEAIPFEARRREKLLQSDVGVSHLRRMLRQEAERQIAALRAAAANPAAAE